MNIRLKTKAEISESALTHNYNTICSHVREHTVGKAPEVICVVKADGYGHGVDTVSEVLGNVGCRFFAVSSEMEAKELRELEMGRGRHPQILILGYTFPENAAAMAELDVICAAVSYDHAILLAAEAEKAGVRLKVHIKLDTGMNRVGFSAMPCDADRTAAQIAELKANPNLDLCGIFTHYAVADDEFLDKKYKEDGIERTLRQLERYKNVLSKLEALGVDPGLRHTANSAAIFGCPDTYFDAVRAGVILYGMFPNGEVNGILRPVMRLSSTVGHTHTMYKGESVSYGGVFTADRDMTVAVITAGYADGYVRRYTGGYVTVNGRQYRQVGRICMDQFMIDITGHESEVHPGDEAVLFGGDDCSALENLARLAQTINYECTCIVTKRVPRIRTK
ncbi:MAG: alanine racemase [Ruminococcaceae bacterium]|nr:alanine racemase [Oscillospiraceae bacterium]